MTNSKLSASPSIDADFTVNNFTRNRNENIFFFLFSRFELSSEGGSGKSLTHRSPRQRTRIQARIIVLFRGPLEGKTRVGDPPPPPLQYEVSEQNFERILC